MSYQSDFAEEKRNLAHVEGQIDFVVSEQKAQAKKYQEELKDSWVLSDPESVEERRYLASTIDSCQKKMQEYAAYKDSPYFGRMDFDVTESGTVMIENEQCYIGKQDIYSADHKHIVIDWRNPVGTFFYQKTEKTFHVNEFEYTLLLRRALDIKGGALRKLETEFDGADVSLEGDVIDPFLLTVLKDKRRHTRLTDIIRTIQGNQNSIIRKPIDESFVVQGCAGSGKTMILLHRLSYLMYNNPRLNLAGIKVITPNRFFDEHIDDLSRELGLNRIERYSVEEYYHYLMSKYTQQVKPLGAIQSEKSLSEAMMGVVYSQEYTDGLVSRYHAYWEAQIRELDYLGFSEYVRRLGIAFAKENNHDSDAYNAYSDAMRRIYAKIKQDADDEIATSSRLDSAKKQLDELQASAAAADAELTATVTNVSSRMSRAIESAKQTVSELVSRSDEGKAKIKVLTAELETVNAEKEKAAAGLRESEASGQKLTRVDYYANLRSETHPAAAQIAAECAPLIAQIRNCDEEIERIKSECGSCRGEKDASQKAADEFLEPIRKNGAAYTDYNTFIALNADDAIVKLMRSALHESINRIHTAELQLESIPRYNFAKRNKSKAEVQEAYAAFHTAAEVYLDKLHAEKNSQVSRLGEKINALTEEKQKLIDTRAKLEKQYTAAATGFYSRYLNELHRQAEGASAYAAQLEQKLENERAAIDNNAKRIREANAQIAALSDGIVLLKQSRCINLAAVPAGKQAYLTAYAKEINSKFKTYKNAANKYRTIQESIPTLEKKLREIRDRRISTDQRVAIEKCSRVIQGLGFEELENAVFIAALKDTYKEHKQAYNRNTYRHKVYLRLLAYSLYYKRTSVADTFINIDEAQDISVVEYHLLRKILGPRCVFNLYGDVNQAVYSYKGIGVWEEEIPDIIGGNVYLLNENYRNTIQITDYCNRVFDVGMTAIGIKGTEVEETAFDQAMAWIKQTRQENPDARTAVIYRHGAHKVEEMLLNAFAGYPACSLGSVNDKQVSVITTETAKGLEFEYVVAVTEKMSENEQYVAFTRALDGLKVVKPKEEPLLPVETPPAFTEEPKTEDAAEVPAADITDTSVAIAPVMKDAVEEIKPAEVRTGKTSIKDAGLSKRATNGLLANKVLFVEDLMEYSADQIYQFRTLGEKSVQEILLFKEQYLRRVDSKANVSESCPDDLMLYHVFPACGSAADKTVKFQVGDSLLDDLRLDETDLSVRIKNALDASDYSSIKTIMFSDFTMVKQIKNLGTLSFNELLKYLKKVAVLIDTGKQRCDDGRVRAVIDLIWGDYPDKAAFLAAAYPVVLGIMLDAAGEENETNDAQIALRSMQYPTLREFTEKRICSVINVSGHLSYEDVCGCLPRIFASSGAVDEALEHLCQNNIVRKDGNVYKPFYPTLCEWLSSLDSMIEKIVRLRMEGKTYAEIGEIFGQTKQSISSKVDAQFKKKPKLDEEFEYEYWYTKYHLSYQEMAGIFDIDEDTYRYFNAFLRAGEKNMASIAEDERATDAIKRKVGNKLEEGRLKVFGKSVDPNRDKILEVIGIDVCSDIAVSIDRLEELYKKVLEENGYADTDKLGFSSKRAFVGYVEKRNYFLSVKGSSVRYYDIVNCPIEELVSNLDFDAYHGLEISTRKLLTDNPELMEAYRISDEYELHNLLKQTEDRWNSDRRIKASFTRMPFIAFDDADREKQVRSLLKRLSPISCVDFYAEYEELYGVQQLTFIGNFAKYIDEFKVGDTYSIDALQMPEQELEFLRTNLTEDFYFTEDVENLLKQEFGNETIEHINAAIFKKIGYTQFSSYILRSNWPSGDAYFRALILRDGVVYMQDFEQRLLNLSTFRQIHQTLRNEFELLEYEDKMCLTYERFSSAVKDCCKEKLLEYADEAIRFAEGYSYFTIAELRKDGFRHELHDYEFPEWFYGALLRNSRKIQAFRMGKGFVFYTGSENENAVDFLRALLTDYIKIDIHDLCDELESRYGIQINQYKLIEIINSSGDMYYNSTMEKAYLTEDDFYNEF